jgi:signal-transduction protein with cAMP-binding, CBS, and nucleotidyltransferase domain
LDEADRLIGIVAEADLLRDRIRQDPRIHGHQAPPPDRAEPVSMVMTTPVESVTPGSDAADVARMMVAENIRCVPVVDGYHVVGVVTRRDLLAAGVVRSDADLERDIERELTSFEASSRWQVTVQAGVAEIADFRDDPADRAIVRRLAAAVPGVVAVSVIHQTPDPT